MSFFSIFYISIFLYFSISLFLYFLYLSVLFVYFLAKIRIFCHLCQQNVTIVDNLPVFCANFMKLSNQTATFFATKQQND